MIADNTTSDNKCKYVIDKILGLLYWSMLAACTVGPGTVVTCAKAGMLQDLSLIWCLWFASILAFTLQEGSARLAIHSGKSLGQCIRIKYSGALACMYETAAICWLVSLAVIIGNTLYEANNFAGGVKAVYSLPIVENNDLTARLVACILYAIVVAVLLYFDKTERLGQLLGAVMVLMIALFFVIVCIGGLDPLTFFHGFIPSFPPESGNLIISLVGTTSLGFNLFLGSSMASGRTLSNARYGIATSTFLAMIVSILILIVGSLISEETKEELGENKFNVQLVGEIVEAKTGRIGLYIYAVGFIAAAVSSMLAVPLGAALTVHSVFTDPTPPIEIGDDKNKTRAELPDWIYLSIQIVMVFVSGVAIAAGLKSEDVIQFAQVINGCILPFFAVLLLLCVNDPQFLGGENKQPLVSNIFMIFSVTIAMALAANSILFNIFSSFLPNGEMRIGIAFAIAIVLMVALLLITSLRVQVFRKYPPPSLFKSCFKG